VGFADDRPVVTVERTATTCYRHKKRPTNRRCTRCGQPACPDCLREAPVGSHCLACIKAANRGTRWTEQPLRARRERRLVATGTLAAAALLGLAYTATSPIGGDPRYPDVHDAVVRLGLIGERLAAGEWYRALTSSFILSDPLQALLALGAIVLIGSQLEREEGGVRTMLLYLVASVAGAAAAYVVTGPTDVTWGSVSGTAGLGAAALLRAARWDVLATRTPGVFLALTGLMAVGSIGSIGVAPFVAGAAVGALYGAATTRLARRRDAWRTALVLLACLVASVAVLTSTDAGLLATLTVR
jgi:membrane associated rhomboid family serine protease